MSYLVYDLAILAILLVFAFWGVHRGLILSLCSLLAVLVAFVGAALVSQFWAPSVAGWVQPMVAPSVTAAVESALPDEITDAAQSLEDLLVHLEDADLPLGLGKLLPQLQEDDALTLTPDSLVESLSSSLSAKLAHSIASIGLFAVAFLVILILWHLLGRTLDLVARLPGLHFLNKAGGFVFGAFRGAILLFVCLWIIRWLWSGLIPGEAVEQTKLLRFFMTTNPLNF